MTNADAADRAKMAVRHMMEDTNNLDHGNFASFETENLAVLYIDGIFGPAERYKQLRAETKKDHAENDAEGR